MDLSQFLIWTNIAQIVLPFILCVLLVPLERADECCGFGGSFSVRYPGVSGAMVQDKCAFIAKALATGEQQHTAPGVTAVIATDAGCLMNIAGCLRRQGSTVKAMHLAEVLEKT